VARNWPSRPVERADIYICRLNHLPGESERSLASVAYGNHTTNYQQARAFGGPGLLRFTQPNFQIEIRMVLNSVGKGWEVQQMERINEARLRCLLVSSKDSVHLKTVVAMLHAKGIQTEGGLHRPWRSTSFESSVMVSLEVHPKASVLYKELETPPGTGPTLVSSPAPSSLMERGNRKFLPEFFARPKQPGPTDSGRFWGKSARLPRSEIKSNWLRLNSDRDPLRIAGDSCTHHPNFYLVRLSDIDAALEEGSIPILIRCAVTSPVNEPSLRCPHRRWYICSPLTLPKPLLHGK
jgi:hypothetical protein